MAKSILELRSLNLSEAEKKVLDLCQNGKYLSLGSNCPTKPHHSYNIRSEVLRYIILGGCKDFIIDNRLIVIRGAYITGILDISYLTSNISIMMINCNFAEEIRARHSEIKSLSLRGCSINGFNAQRIKAEGDIRFSEKFKCVGEINISGCSIGGQFSCTNANVINPSGTAINGISAQVGSGIYLNNNSTFKGKISLSGSTIGGQFSCSGSAFINPDGDAISAEGISIKGPLFLNNGFNSIGRVSIYGASLKSLHGSKGTFKNPESTSLEAGDMRVDGGVYINNGFLSEGRVNIGGSSIGGQLSCSNGSFLNVGKVSLRAQSVKANGGIFLKYIVAKGEVIFSGSSSGGQFSCTGASFSNPDGKALSINGIKINTSMIWKKVSVGGGVLEFSAASAEDLSDDFESWMSCDMLILHGLTYNRISGGFTDIKKRIAWLRHGSTYNNEFHPQPYTQLAKVFRGMGHDKSSQNILLERGAWIRSHNRSNNKIKPNGDWGVAIRSIISDSLNIIYYLWDVLQRLVVGYGYKPERSFWALLFLLAIAAFLSGRAWSTGAMVPNSDVIITSPGWQSIANSSQPSILWTSKGGAGEDWETFNKYAWAFDVVVPIVGLGQVDAWAPSASRSYWGWITWWAKWILSILGWFVAALGASAVTGIIRRE